MTSVMEACLDMDGAGDHRAGWQTPVRSARHLVDAARLFGAESV